MSDTIFAPATAPGRAAVAVVRLSGPGTGDALVRLCGGLPSPRLASLRKLRDAGGELLDEALVLWFPGPGSYTGEDAAELQVHGGSAVVERVLEALAAQGLRLAEPGEFTRRAFQNGRMDLAQAEAVADLVDAETEAQAKQALTQLGGGLSRRYDAWRTSLIDALAVLDAAVDFPDEDLPEDVAARARPTLAALLVEIGQALDGADRGRRVREGFRIALIGAPNAGKSSLLNALAGRDAAIVTATPGTTRDVIEVPLTLSGYRVLLADTAGIRETDEEIEAEGVRRARAWAEGADLRLWVVDGSLTPCADEAESLLQAGDIRLLNKADLGLENHPGRKDLDSFSLSLVDGEGVEALKTILASRVVEALSGAEFPAATRIRHAESLSEAHFRLSAALAEVEAPELAAENVRLAARALARVTGRIDAEDVLDKVFSSFCIGK